MGSPLNRPRSSRSFPRLGLWRPTAWAVSLGLTLLVACKPAGPKVVDAGLSLVDAGPPALPELTLRVTGELLDGGSVDVDFEAGGGTAEVEPVAGLRVSANLPLSNYRIRLMDEADKVVESDDRAEVMAEKLDYRIGLLAPLRPGRRYALVLDAQTGPVMVDTSGRELGELRLELQVAGEREPDRPLKPASGGKTKRRR